jgi:hypothetical protein
MQEQQVICPNGRNLTMSFLRQVTLLLAALVIYQLLAPSASYAYLDPGTGSYILQMAMAAVLGSLFAIKMFWKRIVAFFKGLSSGSKNEETK